jgi:hypothetical protein
MEFVYHFKPENMVGTKLLPLNSLLKLYPEVGKEHVKKYKNRETILQQYIPPLNCLWNDAIHLAPINPQIIFDLWKELEFDLPKGKFMVFRIPSSVLNETRTATFMPCGKRPVTDFSVFRHDAFKELKLVPKAQIDDWYDQRATGWPLFWYSSIQHIVTCDEIDISSCDVFQLT